MSRRPTIKIARVLIADHNPLRPVLGPTSCARMHLAGDRENPSAWAYDRQWIARRSMKNQRHWHLLKRFYCYELEKLPAGSKMSWDRLIDRALSRLERLPEEEVLLLVSGLIDSVDL